MPQNPQDIVDQRRAIVSNLYLKGWTQHAIALNQNVTQGTISQDLTAIRQAWKESMVFDFNEAKAKELAKIDLVEIEFWKAWDESMKPLKRKSTKMTGTVEAGTKPEDRQRQTPKNIESTETSEERLGDPRYLEGILRCVERRAKLLGLDSQQDTEPEEKNLPSWLLAARPQNLN